MSHDWETATKQPAAHMAGSEHATAATLEPHTDLQRRGLTQMTQMPDGLCGLSSASDVLMTATTNCRIRPNAISGLAGVTRLLAATASDSYGRCCVGGPDGLAVSATCDAAEMLLRVR